MNAALLVMLVLLWAVFLLPGALRARRSSPVTSVGTFERAMRVLARRGGGSVRSGEGRYVYVPQDASVIVGDRERRRQEIVERRRRLFVRLLIATGATLPFAAFLGGAAWFVFLGSAGVLTGYAVLLRRWKLQADQAAEVVRHLPDLDEVERPAEPGARTAPIAAGGEPPVPDFQVADGPDERWPETSSVRIRHWQG